MTLKWSDTNVSREDHRRGDSQKREPKSNGEKGRGFEILYRPLTFRITLLDYPISNPCTTKREGDRPVQTPRKRLRHLTRLCKVGRPRVKGVVNFVPTIMVRVSQHVRFLLVHPVCEYSYKCILSREGTLASRWRQVYRPWNSSQSTFSSPWPGPKVWESSGQTDSTRSTVTHRTRYPFLFRARDFGLKWVSRQVSTWVSKSVNE